MASEARVSLPKLSSQWLSLFENPISRKKAPRDIEQKLGYSMPTGPYPNEQKKIRDRGGIECGEIDSENR